MILKQQNQPFVAMKSIPISEANWWAFSLIIGSIKGTFLASTCLIHRNNAFSMASLCDDAFSSAYQKSNSHDHWQFSLYFKGKSKGLKRQYHTYYRDLSWLLCSSLITWSLKFKVYEQRAMLLVFHSCFRLPRLQSFCFRYKRVLFVAQDNHSLYHKICSMRVCCKWVWLY